MNENSLIIDGVTYVRLFMSCPVCGEVKNYWQHADCGGDIYIGDNATFYCGNCHETIPCVFANFECPNHGNSTGYLISRAKAFQHHNINPAIDWRSISGLKFLNKLNGALIAQTEEHIS